MVTPKLRDLLSRAPGNGSLAGDSVLHGSGEHPVCGDVVELDVRLADDRIAELRWRAQGCPATLAVASLAAEVLAGQVVADAASCLRSALVAAGDLEPHERHAEAMFGRALRAAIADGADRGF